MADNIRTRPSPDVTAVDVRTDEVSGAHYQVVKAGFGADGAATHVADSDGSRWPVGGAQIGALEETAPASDIASAGLNGRLQRIAQRLTSLIALLPPALGAGGGLKVDGSGTALPVSGTVTANAGTNLNTSALALEATQNSLIGALTETAPATDTASSGLNGRLQRIAQRITSLIALLPSSLGTKTAANSLAVVLASDGVLSTAASASDEGDESATDEAVAGAAAGTRLMGFSARETSGTAGSHFRIRRGTSNSDPLLVDVTLSSGESAREWYGPEGLEAAAGIWVERVSGATSFIGYYKVVS